MNTADLVIATMTWARNAAEEELLRAAFACLAATGIPVTVADGGSGRGFLDYLDSFSNVSVIEAGQPGVLSQIKSSLRAAGEAGRKRVLYIESDKSWFCEKKLREFISHAPDDKEVGVVIASRSPDSFLTYPKSQRYCESVINDLCAQSFDLAADYSYGPMIIARDLLADLEPLAADVGWGWRHFMFGAAHRTGRAIVPWTADLPCPAGQRADGEAERLHRLRQLSENVRGLTLALALPSNKFPAPGSDRTSGMA